MEGGHLHGQDDVGRQFVGGDCAAFAGEASAAPVSRTEAIGRPRGADRDSVRVEDGDSLGGYATRDGLRVGDDMLAEAARLAEGRRLGHGPPDLAGPAPGSRENRLFACGGGLGLGAGGFGGAQTGPNPTDRRKAGSKHHLITDANGIPLATVLTGANRNDVTQLLVLVESIPPVAGHVGPPRFRPDRVQGDRGYDSMWHRRALRARGITPVLARRGTAHGSGLGATRWVVERTLSWLHQFRRLRVRWERRADIHEAFMALGCIVICHRALTKSFC
jgi:transposase